MKTPPPLDLATIHLDELAAWIAMRREIIARDGYAARASEGALSIELKARLSDDATPSARMSNEWHPLTLPGGALAFVNAEQRDLVLAGLEGRG